MSGLKQKAEVIKGSDRPLKIQIIEVDEAGVERPVDMTNAAEIKACFFNQDNTIAEFLFSNGGISKEVGASGIISIDWEEAATDLLRAGNNQSFEVLYTIGSNTSIVQFIQALDVKERICSTP